jgi:hypothetical protein
MILRPRSASWSNNIGWDTSSAGQMPVSGYTTVNPSLVADAIGIYRLQSGSRPSTPAAGLLITTAIICHSLLLPPIRTDSPGMRPRTKEPTNFPSRQSVFVC